MNSRDTAAGFLADMVRYSTRRSHVHTLSMGLEGFCDEDLAYCPVPELALDWQDEWRHPAIQTPRRLIIHMIAAARHYSNGLVGEKGAERNAEWVAANLAGIADDAEALTARLEAELRLLHERAASLSDAELLEPARETWDGEKAKGFVVMDGGILHTAWHLGQLAMLIDWRAAQGGGHELAPPTGPPGEYAYPCERDWSDFHVATAKEMLLRVARSAYEDSPAHALRMVCSGMTEDELAWKPFAGIENPWFCRAMWVLVLHTWSPKVVYIDHALGERKLNYGDGDDHIGGCGWGETDPEKCLRALGRANQWLVDHVEAATEEELDRTNPMHIDTPLTGWEAAACMAQHDAWHAGQLSLMRDLYRALWERREGLTRLQNPND